ncbi:MAG: fused MFS/spermidine synthase [Planctomycetes bacterium]|nr:fused MFS/spermidine synthase [Planctomycetota bacterium]
MHRLNLSRKVLPLGIAAVLAICALAPADQKILYEQESPYNMIVVLEDEDGLRSLQFEREGALQSVVKVGDPDHLVLPYARAMPLGLVFVEEPARVLIVGLGGGTIPGFLHKHFPKMTIDVVDIDPDVVAVAKEFFGFREDETLHAFVDDGRGFIERNAGRYDIIFLDAFDRENIPYHLATREFLAATRRALTPKGIVVSNIWSRYSNPLYDGMVRTYQDVFEQLYVFDVLGSGNKIVVAIPRTGKLGRAEVARKAREISKQEGFRFDMGDVAQYGYNFATDMTYRAAVLRDKKEKPEAKAP